MCVTNSVAKRFSGQPAAKRPPSCVTCPFTIVFKLHTESRCVCMESYLKMIYVLIQLPNCVISYKVLFPIGMLEHILDIRHLL